jgi:hypothetical protein
MLIADWNQQSTISNQQSHGLQMNVALVSHDFEEYCVRLANGLADMANVRLLLPWGRARAHPRPSIPE